MKKYLILFVQFIIVLLIQIDGITENQVVPVTVYRLNLRKEPNNNSAVIRQLEIGSFVEVIEIQKYESIVNGKKGKWAFVEATSGIKGWVFDYYLGFKERFTKLSSWDYESFFGCDGDSCPAYEFNKDGQVAVGFWQYSDKNTTPEDNKKSCEKNGGKYHIVDSNNHYCVFKGHLYRYNNLILTELDNYKGDKDFWHLLFIEKGKLCLYHGGCVDKKGNKVGAE